MKISLQFLVLCFLTLTACGGPRYQINVGNGSPRLPLQDVTLSADEKKMASFSVIAPAKVAACKPKGGKLPERIFLSWRDAEGKNYQESIQVSDSISPNFTGQLVVEITEKNTLTLTQVESSGEELSTLPWAMPEAWEGSVQLPGME